MRASISYCRQVDHAVTLWSTMQEESDRCIAISMGYSTIPSTNQSHLHAYASRLRLLVPLPGDARASISSRSVLIASNLSPCIEYVVTSRRRNGGRLLALNTQRAGTGNSATQLQKRICNSAARLGTSGKDEIDGPTSCMQSR